jgi:hypothetical protein
MDLPGPTDVKSLPCPETNNRRRPMIETLSANC